MTHRGRPRVHLLTGGPAWEERRAAPKPGYSKAPYRGFSKNQRKARKPLNAIMAQLAEAMKQRDWRAARIARSAAWDEVNKLDEDLTRQERKKLWQYKQSLLAGEAQDRRRDVRRRTLPPRTPT
ncbi:hypothetical protein [Streptomyces cupreus]|uniref:Uncharacterized protein n=1 Tax=Streptomyces cupreus TaxID=2759956 RepID=A0A7X1JAS9_9ACTN|nr:hypothetical protein [Streptomyces cupreus]MBC2907334.1 hypothetical protein [Streptomyces cupreus]